MAYEPKASQQAMQQGSMLSTAPATLGVLPKFYAQQSAALVLKLKEFGFKGEDWITVNDLNGNPAFKAGAEAFSLSHRVHVSNPEGQRLFTIRRERSSGTPFKAYAEDPQGGRLFDFSGVRSCGPMKNKISFINVADGRNVELKIKMGRFDKIIDIRLADTDMVIASIERSRRPTKFVITITPNVDASLVVAMCICLYQRIKLRQSSSSGAAGPIGAGGVAF